MTKLKAQSNRKKRKFSLFITIVIMLLFASLPAYCDDIRQTPIVKAVSKVSPAVVNISSEYEVKERVSPFSGLGQNPYFDFFFKDFFDPRFEQKTKRTSLGSGVIIDGEKGFILTNAHVIEKAGNITVTLKDEREFQAQAIGADKDYDLAVLRISSNTTLPSIKMGCCDDLMIGETVIAIGNPFGFSNTVTTGVISAINRSIKTDDRIYHNFIQTDASINPGNSGGPLLNIKGELIGINTAIYAKAQGIGFAIPINTAKRIISDLIQYGEVVQVWVGVIVQDITPHLAQYLNFNKNKGVIIKAIESTSPAQIAGLYEGDIILSIGSNTISSTQDYDNTIRNYGTGDIVKFNIWRNGITRSITLKGDIFPEDKALELAYKLLGIKVKNRSTSYLYQRDRTQGIVITDVSKDSYLAQIGTRPGDIIRQIDDIKIQDINNFKKAIIKYRNKSSIIILLQRGGQGYYITVNL